MKICHVVGTSAGWGGLERCVVDLAGIQITTHEVLVLGASSVLKRLRSGVQTGQLPMHQSRWDPRLLWSLRREIVRFKPDVVHAHAGKAASLVRTLRPFLPRIATVASIHGTKRSVRCFSGFDRLIAVSRRVGQALQGMPHQVIWNGIHRGQMPNRSSNAGDFPFLGRGKPVMMAVGRLVEEKAFDVLLAALEKVDAYLWLAGDGQLRGKLEAQARALGIEKRVWFAGFRSDVAQLACLTDFIVISSRREGFPLAMVEMLHLRRPVVGTRVGGVEEVLPDEWICDPDDVHGLTQLLERAITRLPSLVTEFEPVFQLAARELTIESASAKIETVYRDALGNSMATPVVSGIKS